YAVGQASRSRQVQSGRVRTSHDMTAGSRGEVSEMHPVQATPAPYDGVAQEQTDRWQMTAPSSAVTVPPAAWLVALALGIVYVVWGSTYLAIRVVVEDLPPFASASWRYLAAGLLLGAILSLRGGIRRLRVVRCELVGCAALGLLLPSL